MLKFLDGYFYSLLKNRMIFFRVSEYDWFRNPFSHFESVSIPGEIPSIIPLPSESPPNQSGSSSTGVDLLKRPPRPPSSGSNRGLAPKPDLSLETKKRHISSTVADTLSTSALLNLPIELLRYIGKLEPKAAIAMRPACKLAEVVFSKMVPYIHIKKQENLVRGLAFFKETEGRATLELESVRCKAKTFKTLFKKAKHLNLNGVSFTEADITEEYGLAKFKSLHLNAKLSGDVFVALLKNISPENLKTLNLNSCGPLSVEDINAFPTFTALQTVSARGVWYAPSKAKQVLQYFSNQAAQLSQAYSDQAAQALQEKVNPNGLVIIEM